MEKKDGKTAKELHKEDPEKYSDQSDSEEEAQKTEKEAPGPSKPPSKPGVKSAKDLHKEDPEKYSDESDDEVSEELIRKLIGVKIKEENPKVLDEVSLDGIVKYISSGKAKNIVTMSGAGISTAAGIPDFRSPETGLYHQLKEYDLPYPEAIFTLDFFRKNPSPFLKLAKELYPGKFAPTKSHFFIKLLEKKGLLLRHYTQNIDTLERICGVSDDKLVEAHGTFHLAHCVDCKKEFSQQWVKDEIFQDKIPTCTSCYGLVKPDIVFFGEQLPETFFVMAHQDLPKCDLLIIMGTSLTVQPFASLIGRVSATCPRLLLNKTKCSNDGNDYILRLLGRGGLDFDTEDNYRDVARIGDCDQGCQELVDKLGWKDDLDSLISSWKPEEEN